MSGRVLRASDRLYRFALYLYPRDFRRVYGELMRQAFHDVCREAYKRGGKRSLGMVWAQTCGDLLTSAAVEHFESFRRERQMTRKSLITWGVVVLFSLITGYVNLNASEVQAPMGCLLLFSFIAGLLQPKAAWRWALLIGLSVPMSYFIGFAVNYKVVDPPRLPITLVVLVIPALVAVYLGALLHRGLAHPAINTPVS